MTEEKITLIDQLDELEELLLESNRVPFSPVRLVNENDAVEILDLIRHNLPNQLIESDKIVKNCDSLIKHAEKQGIDIIKGAQNKRKSLLDTTEIRQSAKQKLIEIKRKEQQEYNSLISNSKSKVKELEKRLMNQINIVENNYKNTIKSLEKEEQRTRKEILNETVIYRQSLKEEIYIDFRNKLQQLNVIKAQIHSQIQENMTDAQLIKKQSKNLRLEATTNNNTLIRRIHQANITNDNL